MKPEHLQIGELYKTVPFSYEVDRTGYPPMEDLRVIDGIPKRRCPHLRNIGCDEIILFAGRKKAHYFGHFYYLFLDKDGKPFSIWEKNIDRLVEPVI